MATELWDRTRQRSVPLWLAIVAAALIIARIVSHQTQPKAGTGDLVTWVPLAYAQERAVEQNKLIMYDFTAAWCGPCHLLDKEVFRDAKLAQRINERFVAVQVVDRMQEDGVNHPTVATLQRRYEVSAFPTVIIVDAKGIIHHKMVGYAGKSRVADMIERVR